MFWHILVGQLMVKVVFFVPLFHVIYMMITGWLLYILFCSFKPYQFNWLTYIYIHTYYTHIVWVDSIRQLCLPQVFLVGPSLFSVIVWMLETALMNWDVSANCNEMVLHPNKTNITASVWDLRKHQPDTLWSFGSLLLLVRPISCAVLQQI